MERQIRWVGAALAAGAVLMLTRIAPIVVILPDDMVFPPESTQEMVRLAQIAGLHWQMSHGMGLAAIALFAAAYGWHVVLLMRRGWKRIGILLAIMATAAFTLFGTALVIDGFVVPVTVDSYVSANGGQSTTLSQVAESHQLALRFFTPGILLMFVSMIVLSAAMLHRVIHTRWLGLYGQIVGVVAVAAYLTGITGAHWNVMQIAGTLMLAAFVWHLVVGCRALFAESHAEAL